MNSAHDYQERNMTVPSHCCYGAYICFPVNVKKPGCLEKAKNDFRTQQLIMIVQMVVVGVIKIIFLVATLMAPVDKLVMHYQEKHADEDEEESQAKMKKLKEKPAT